MAELENDSGVRRRARVSDLVGGMEGPWLDDGAEVQSLMLRIRIHERVFVIHPNYTRHIVLAVQVNNYGRDDDLTRDVVAKLLIHSDLERLGSVVPSGLRQFIRNPHSLYGVSEKCTALILSMALKFDLTVYAEDLARLQDDRELRMEPPKRTSTRGDSVYVGCSSGQLIRRSWDRLDTGCCRVTATSREILFTINSFEDKTFGTALEARETISRYVAKCASASVRGAELSRLCKSLAMGVRSQEIDADPGKHLMVEFVPVD